LRLNPRHIERARLMRGFVGGVVDRQKAVMDPDPNYFGAPWLTEDQLITQCGLEHVDFLKCDIEGGEFALLGGQSRLLAMTRSLAMEIHAFAGDVDWLIGKLISQGFQIISRDDAPDGSCVILAKRA